MASNQSKKKKMHLKKNRNTKECIVFDESARREYLTGFRKRKDERRRIAAENLLKEMKEEKKRLKQQVRDMMKSKVDNQPSVPEIQHLLDPTVYDLPSHTVTVTDVSEVDLTGKDGLWLGQNTFRDEPTGEAEEGKEPSTDEASSKTKQRRQDPKEVKRLKRKMAKVGQNNFKKLKQTQQKKSRRRQKRATKPSKGKRKK